MAEALAPPVLNTKLRVPPDPRNEATGHHNIVDLLCLPQQNHFLTLNPTLLHTPAQSRAHIPHTGECLMSSKRFLLVLAFAMFTGSLAGNITATPKKKLCIPCTPYCKAHPNAPRCN